MQLLTLNSTNRWILQEAELGNITFRFVKYLKKTMEE
jgi:hypothetical protein